MAHRHTSAPPDKRVTQPPTLSGVDNEVKILNFSFGHIHEHEINMYYLLVQQTLILPSIKKIIMVARPKMPNELLSRAFNLFV